MTNTSAEQQSPDPIEQAEPAVKRQRLENSLVTRVSDSGEGEDVSEVRDVPEEPVLVNDSSAFEEIQVRSVDPAIEATPAVVLPAVTEAPVEASQLEAIPELIPKDESEVIPAPLD